jgi:hypothetical protein
MDFVTATLWAMNVLDTNVLVVVKARTRNIVLDFEVLILRQCSSRQRLAIVLYYDGLQIGSSGHYV